LIYVKVRFRRNATALAIKWWPCDLCFGTRLRSLGAGSVQTASPPGGSLFWDRNDAHAVPPHRPNAPGRRLLKNLP